MRRMMKIQQYFRIRNQINEVSRRWMSQMESIDKLNLEQADIVNIILTRSRTSLINFRAIIETLCLKIQQYNPYDDFCHQYRMQVEQEMNQWQCMEERNNHKNVLLRKNQKQYTDLKSEINQKNKKSLVQLPNGFRKALKLKKEPTLQDYHYKLSLRDQFFKIKQYVSMVLAPMMEYSEGGCIPKKVAFNCYLRYLQQRKMKIQIDYFSRIQMELTNQIKECFPNAQLSRKNFYGLSFKKEYHLQMELTDRQPLASQEDMAFNGDDFDDPIDEFLRQKKENDLKSIGLISRQKPI